MIVYSFFLHGSVMPRNRTNHDLDALKSTVFSAGKDVPAQWRINAEVVDGLSSHLRSTLRWLQKATILPDYDHLADLDQERLEERQSEIGALIKLYTDQITRDYNAFRLQKEQLSSYCSRNYGEMEKHIQTTLDQNRKAIINSLHDMRNVLESQKKMVKDVLDKNIEIMTVEYRDYVINLQSTNDHEYRS